MNKNIDAFKSELKELLTKYNMKLELDILEGYGALDTDFVAEDEDGYLYVLNHHSTHLYASDIE